MQVKFSLLIPLLIFSVFIPSGTRLASCQAQEIQRFGQDAPKSGDGARGQDGQDSANTAIFVDGSPISIDLSGNDGLPGEDGAQGADAICELQPLGVTENLIGATGGEGGNGGNGGKGGNGGNVTVYVTNPTDLQQVSIVTRGGTGGAPGAGGNGGSGCQCEQPFWTEQSCSGKPGQAGFSCTTIEYTCQNGATGKEGRSGNQGRDGQPGNLTLINSDRPLGQDRAAATVSFAELKDRGFTLSRNQWETRTGAGSLFAPGSIIADQYIELTERVEKSVLLVWNAPQSFQNFGNQLATLKLLDNQEVEITTPEDVWLEFEAVENNNLTELIVVNAVLRQQAVQLASEGITNNGTDLLLTVSDTAQLSDLVNSEFSIRYRTVEGNNDILRRNRNSRTRFEGEIPPELITYQYNQFVIAVGELPIESRFLTAGTNIEIDLIVTRTFLDNSAVQQVNFRGTIGR